MYKHLPQKQAFLIFTFDKAFVQEKAKDQEKKKERDLVSQLTYPLTAFGLKSLPKDETTLFKNATVWTSEKEGILENTDVLIKNSKIEKIGKNLSVAKDVIVIDATGKHLTAGIIDEHSHIALDAVNESSESVGAEQGVGDVVNSTDISIYRNLAGGVTMAQLLHGSANAIGGKAQVIKMRWGMLPEDIKI